MSPQTYLIMHIYFLTYILTVGTDALVCPYLHIAPATSSPLFHHQLTQPSFHSPLANCAFHSPLLLERGWG